MNIHDAIEMFLDTIDDCCYKYNKQTNTIEKSTIFVSGFVEQNQMLRIIEVLDELSIKYEVQINGSIKLLI